MVPALIQREAVTLKLSKLVILLIKDDLTALPVDAFVYYAREDLDLGSGYGTAIQQRGGIAIKKELEAIGRVEMGQAVITGAGAMTPRQIIHACGPKFFERELESKLRNCVLSALKLARENGVRTLAFPPMGTGFYGVPLALSARVMLEAFSEFDAEAEGIEEIIICANDQRDFNALTPLVQDFMNRG